MSQINTFIEKDNRLSRGMRYVSKRKEKILETLSFDSASTIQVLFSFFGPFSFIGVRKLAPRIKSTLLRPNPCPIEFGDTLNVVDASMNATELQKSRDRVDLMFDGSSLKILARYSKVVLSSLEDIRVPILGNKDILIYSCQWGSENLYDLPYIYDFWYSF